MRNTTGLGRPNHKVIPDQWAAHHRPTAEGTMTALCEVRGPDVRTWDDDLRDYTTVPGVLRFAGRCRVQRIERGSVYQNAGQSVTAADYLVTLPFAANNIWPADVVRFTQVDDTDLITQELAVTVVQQGSLRWERDLFCINNQG